MHTPDFDEATKGRDAVIGRRLTIHVHASTREFLEGSAVSGRSHSERLARLAERYRAIMADSSILRSWRPADLAAVIAAGRGIEMQQPQDAYVLSVRLKAMDAKAEHRGTVELGALSYRVASLGLTDVLRLIDLCERYPGDDLSPEAVEAWLMTQAAKKG